MSEHTNFPTVSEAVIGEATVPAVNARELHACLMNRDHFATWIKDRIRLYGFVEHVDFVTYSEVSEKGGRPSQEYAITLDMAKELAMVERTEQGKQARRYFLECERRLKDGQPRSVNIRDIGELSKITLQLIEFNQELEQRAVTAEEKAADAEARIEADKPKTGFFDRFMNADGVFGLQNAGRILIEPPNKFIRWLKEDFLFYQGGSLVPRAQYRTMGLFEVKATMIEDKARYQTYVTPRGLQYLARKLGKDIPGLEAGA